MLFHVTYSLAPENRDAAQSRFKETGGLPPEGVTMIGRWHCAQGLKGFTVAEASDGEAIASWIQQWTDILSFEITLVVDDDQMTRVIG